MDNIKGDLLEVVNNTEMKMSFIDWYATIRKELLELRAFLNVERIPDANDLDATLEVGRVWLARSVELLATAEQYYVVDLANAIAEIATEQKYAKIGPMLLKQIASGKVAAQKKVYTEIERTNACLTHSIDVWRSRLSFHKEELKITNRRESNG